MNLYKSTPLWRKILKILCWTVMACVLAAAAAVMCVVRVLSPEHLTAITEHAANRIFDADVSLGRVELSLQGRMPLLRISVDSVTVISRQMLRLTPERRDSLPIWADTLLTLQRFEGGINISALLQQKIDLYDVQFDAPAINLAVLNDSVNNYSIYISEAEEDEDESDGLSVPAISVNRFSIINPRPIRYFDAHTGDSLDIALHTLSVDGGDSSSYRLDIGGGVRSTLLNIYNLESLGFGVNGRIVWNPEKPSGLQFDDFRMRAGFIDATVSAYVDFDSDVIVNDYSLELSPVPLDSIVSVIPDSLRRCYGLGKFASDVAVGIDVRSTAPFNLTTDLIPMADVTLRILPGELRYGVARFRNISGTLHAFLRGNDLNAASFEAEDLNVTGPATDLTFNVRASQVLNDALIEGSVDGVTSLQHLPVQLRRMIGSYLSGRMTANVTFKARPSMFSRNNFHRLYLDGRVTGRDLCYMPSDTSGRITAHKAEFTFGTHVPTKASSMLSAVIKVDSADMSHPGYSVVVSDFSLGVGVSNRRPSADTTLVIPMGGGLSIGKLRFVLPDDSVALFIRGAKGIVTVQRYKDRARTPLLGLDIDVRNIFTGSPDARLMLSGASVHAKAFKLPDPPMRKAINRTADSIMRMYPGLPADSAYRRAVDIHRSRSRSRNHRAQAGYTTEESEIIDWGTSRFMRRMLLGWDIRGSIKASRAGLLTGFFPLRNRVSNFNLEFCNDSVTLTDVRYKAGSSDFTMSGCISNIKRGFTSRGFRSPVKLNFELNSDTIDVNELAGSAFAGSAYAVRSGRDFNVSEIGDVDCDSDEMFEREVARVTADAYDSVAPLLVPHNIEADLNIHAANILYSDLIFHNLSGRMLVSQGAVNLRNLSAESDAGSINLSALYSAPSVKNLKFGFGMQVNGFNVQRFTKLMPALDSIMPLLRDFSGIIDADVAATCDIDSGMNLVLPTLAAAVRISGDSLRLIDKETYRTIGKWLMFKNKQDNLIKSMNVELTVSDNTMRIYPFVFDLDRYRLGVQGYNDLALNFDYHIAVLKSPLPFKFGINLSGNPDRYKVRLGKAHLNEREVAQSVNIVDTTRVNLLAQIENVFRRGVANSRFARVNIANRPAVPHIDISSDTITRADSLVLIREGVIPAPEVPVAPVDENVPERKSRKRGSAKDVADDALKPEETNERK